MLLITGKKKYQAMVYAEEVGRHALHSQFDTTAS